MVFVPLSVAPCYRPWRLAGIRHVLMAPDSVEAVNDILAQKKQIVSTLTAPQAVPARAAIKTVTVASSFSGQVSEELASASPITGAMPSTGSPQTRLLSTASIQTENFPPVKTEKILPSQSEKVPLAQSEKKSQEQGAKAAQEVPHEVLSTQKTAKTDFEKWPLPWQERLTASAKQPLVVWSYAALKEDFAGNGEVARSELVRRLYVGMALRKGSHVLWPLQLVSDSNPRPDIFCSAMDILRPRLLVLLYDQVPDGLGMAQLACYQLACPAALSGLSVLLGPSMENLVAGKAPLEPLLQMVRSILAPFIPAS